MNVLLKIIRRLKEIRLEKELFKNQLHNESTFIKPGLYFINDREANHLFTRKPRNIKIKGSFKRCRRDVRPFRSFIVRLIKSITPPSITYIRPAQSWHSRPGTFIMRSTVTNQFKIFSKETQEVITIYASKADYFEALNTANEIMQHLPIVPVLPVVKKRNVSTSALVNAKPASFQPDKTKSAIYKRLIKLYSKMPTIDSNREKQPFFKTYNSPGQLVRHVDRILRPTKFGRLFTKRKQAVWQLLSEDPQPKTHGDLHGENILVAQDQDFVLIDLETSGSLPFFFDILFYPYRDFNHGNPYLLQELRRGKFDHRLNQLFLKFSQVPYSNRKKDVWLAFLALRVGSAFRVLNRFVPPSAFKIYLDPLNYLFKTRK